MSVFPSVKYDPRGVTRPRSLELSRCSLAAPTRLESLGVKLF